jgi:hypothetical protein
VLLFMISAGLGIALFAAFLPIFLVYRSIREHLATREALRLAREFRLMNNQQVQKTELMSNGQ